MSLLSIFPTSNVGGIEVDATLEEVHTDTLRITEHPVEKGAAITDHSYKEPTELIMKCGWSQSSLSAVAGALRSAAGLPTQSNDMGTGTDYIGRIYGDLLRMQEQRQLVTVVTVKRRYSDMAIASLSTVTDETTSSILLLTVTLRGVRIVTTKATTLPDKSKQAEAPSTVSSVDTGAKATTLVSQ